MVLVELEKAGVLDKFDELQDHNDGEINQIVWDIVKEFMPFIQIKQRWKESLDENC